MTEDVKLHYRDEISEIQTEGNCSISQGEKTGRTEGEPADKWFSTWGGCVTSSQWQRLEMLLNIP